MISDEAVEAAAKAMWQRTRVDPWENNADYLAAEWHRHDARLALEAAAAYLMAQAWDEGHDAGARDEEDSYWGPSAASTANPYRSKA